ncbi:hypothetical protein OE88DRAFT_1667407 [Heliocybe sulcata]|uniref:Uncharacterized protein n=1 Tax=Heliocybe sulcata TaxID=5364 RepID=A0A5C3MPK4_9AGAM|nr:hypothetical protein OE88DRAFT_1667407 [Heliocybe sulcata]
MKTREQTHRPTWELFRISRAPSNVGISQQHCNRPPFLTLSASTTVGAANWESPLKAQVPSCSPESGKRKNYAQLQRGSRMPCIYRMTPRLPGLSPQGPTRMARDPRIEMRLLSSQQCTSLVIHHATRCLTRGVTALPVACLHELEYTGLGLVRSDGRARLREFEDAAHVVCCVYDSIWRM